MASLNWTLLGAGGDFGRTIGHARKVLVARRRYAWNPQWHLRQRLGAATKGVSCVGCSHSHYLVTPVTAVGAAGVTG